MDQIFSPIKNTDEEKKMRHSDSFSKFLEGPDAFRNVSKPGSCSDKSSLQSDVAVVSEASGSKAIERNNDPSSLSQHSLLSQLHSVESFVQTGATLTSKVSEFKNIKRICGTSSSNLPNILSQGNVNEKTLSIKAASGKKSSQILQDKSTKSEAKKAEILSSSSTILEDALHTQSKSSMKKVDKSDNLQFSSTGKNEDFFDASLTANYEKQIKDQQSETQFKTERKHTSNTNILQPYSIKNSLQANTAIISKSSASKAIKKTKCPTPLSQLDSLSQVQSRIEKMVSDAVESQVDNLQQLMHSHSYNLLKALDETKETMEHRHASERETFCKIMEELAEENRQLRNAAFDHK